MSEKTYKLTISILASNRKDTLPKTLESIKPLLDSVSSELILVDTGCDEELLTIIKKYTDRIVKFEWCKDFSKARNAGLELAKGEWFLFIDDDEWFEDVSELVDFFNSDEKDKYGYGRYIQRNYRNLEGSSWLDAAVGRIFKLREDTHFEGIIHERPVNISGATKNFSVYAHHYGYVYKNESDRKAHFERNISLLREQIKKEPDVARYYAQLAQEYCAAKAGENAMGVSLEGISKVDVSKEENHKDLPGLYAVVVWNLMNQMKHKEALVKAKEYLDSPYCNELCRATMHGFCAILEHRLLHYMESIKHADRFFELKKYFQKHIDARYNQSTVMLIYTLEEENCRRVAEVANASALAVKRAKEGKYAKNRKYAVTISILASNRKDTLPKTLESIRPILENVSSELIVTDTGCDEELLSIIKQYTDNIVKFEWCKDFAKARNLGLELAQGEWFLFIDDDEWFEDVTELIDFFNSTERHKYGSGRYYQRNYRNSEGTQWGDFSAGRIFRIYEDSIFIDAIHERPINTPGAVKHFDVYAHHYGYVYKNEQDRMAKNERNLSLLKMQSEKEPHIARHYAHIAQEYGTAGRYESIAKVVEEGIKNADMTNRENCIDVGGLYGIDVWALMNMRQYDEAIKRAEKYLQSQYCNKLCKATLYGFCATASCELGSYKECIEYGKCFCGIGDYLLENPSERYTMISVVLVYALEKENYNRVAAAGIQAAAVSGDIEALRYFSAYIDASKDFFVKDIDECARRVLEMVDVDADTERNITLLDNILKHKTVCASIIRYVIELKGKDINAYYKIADIIGKTSSWNGYVQYLRIISSYRRGELDKLESLYNKAIATISDILCIDKEFFVIAMQCNIDIGSMLENISLNSWMLYVDKWSVSAKVKELIEKKQVLDMVMSAGSVHMKYFHMLFTEGLLYRMRVENANIEKLKEEMNNYSNVVFEFYDELYVDWFSKNYSEAMPWRYRVALAFKKICEEEIVDIEDECTKVIKLAPLLEKMMIRYKKCKM